MHVTYFGTWEQGHPRNDQTIAALEAAGAIVHQLHRDPWRSVHKFALGPRALPRLLASEAQLALTRIPEPTDALLVGYPGHFDMPSAKAHRKPVVFNPMVSLYDSLVDDRRRFRAGSVAARTLHQIDVRAFRAADLLVADTRTHAAFMSAFAGVDDVAVCYLGTDEQLFQPAWEPREPFSALFVGRLAPLHGVDVIVEAARLLPDIPFRVLGTGQQADLLAGAPSNVEHVEWVNYRDLPAEYANAGCALGIFGRSDKVDRVIPNKVFEALAVGTPIVTADTEGIRELLSDGESALLTARTPDGVAQAIVALRDDTALAQRIGRSGRAVFEREATRAVLGQRWRAAVERAVAGRG